MTTNARPIPTPESLLERLRNDRFDESAPSHGTDDRCCRRSHNRAMQYATELVERWLCERADATPLETALRELAEAPVMDMRLRNALTSDDDQT